LFIGSDIMERLQKVIANSGICSRRKAEELILAGKVIVNNEVITQLGTKVNEKDEIIVDGKVLEKEEHVYFLLNKPRGVVTTASDDKGRTTVVELIDTDKRIYPVGRLDYDTTGALILTNDGEFANLMMHPSNEIDKVYLAKVEGIATGKEVKELGNGVVVDGSVLSSSHVKVKKVNHEKEESFIELTIHEGKNHQVKKMLESVGLPVIKLTRKRIAFLTVDKLKSGEYRKLSNKEVSQLYVLATKK